MTRSQFGSIVRRPNGTYLVRWEDGINRDGTRRQRARVVRGSRDDAELLLAKLRLESGKGCDIAEGMTLEQFWEAFYAPSFRERLEPLTVSGYEQLWRCYVRPLFGSKVMADMRAREIESALWTIEAPYAQRNAHSLLRRMFNEAWNWDMIETNVMQKRIRLRPLGKREQDVYSLDELPAFLDAIRGADFEAAAICSCFGGMRREEALGLEWEDFSWEDGCCVAYVHRAVTEAGRQVVVKGTKTAKSTRRVVISGAAFERLREMRGEGALVPGRHDGFDRPSNVMQRYRRRLRSKGLRVVPWKNLRTTYATIQQQLGTDSAIISAALGHSNYNTAYQHYFSTNEASFRAAAQRLSDAL